MTFDQAARAVLVHLREHVPMGFWVIARVENGRESYLYLDDTVYGATEGGSHPWEESYSTHLAAGTGPAVAPDAMSVPLYAAAGVNAVFTIESYAGSTIKEPDGRLFGVICGMDPQVRADVEQFRRAEPLLVLLGQLLTMVLASDRARVTATVEALESRDAADTDSLTGLPNRRAWDRTLATHAERFRHLADPTVLVMTDLDDLKIINYEQGHAAGDGYIRRAARALRRSLRETDVLARLGGDEFGIIPQDCDQGAADERVARLSRALLAVEVACSFGWAPATPDKGLDIALAEAEDAMHVAKRQSRAVRTTRRVAS